MARRCELKWSEQVAVLESLPEQQYLPANVGEKGKLFVNTVKN
jgi:hypothetical protein